MGIEHDEWARGLARFAKDSKATLDQTVRAAANALAENVIRLTPVGNPALWANPKAAPPGYVGGWARANWWPSLNDKIIPPNTNVERPPDAKVDPNGKIMWTAAMFAKGKAGDVFWIQNGVPYIRRLEYGWSQQAPKGMVGVAVTAVKTFFAQYGKTGAA